MFDFAETTKDMTASEILNYYRNLYYAEPQVTERGIVANAINDFFFEKIVEVETLKAEIEKLKSSIDDHLWDFCSISGCEGASNDCWKTCPDSRYNKIKTEAEKIFHQKIENQREEIKRLRKCLFDVNNSRDYWKAKACRVGKQLHQVLEDMRKTDEGK